MKLLKSLDIYYELSLHLYLKQEAYQELHKVLIYFLIRLLVLLNHLSRSKRIGEHRPFCESRLKSSSLLDDSSRKILTQDIFVRMLCPICVEVSALASV